MGTLAAQVDATGISAPDFANVLQQLRSQLWGIYGSDANLADDTQDGQFLAVLARAIDDTNQTAIAVYNAYSPATAQGAGLSSVVKINGMTRHVATNSQVDVLIAGQVGTIITNGVVGDDQGLGTQWTLPAEVTIPVEGEITVTATCTEVGSTAASAGTITVILTPTLGWQTVSNALAATAGEPIETDAELRRRQSVSTSLPAKSVLETLKAGVAALAGVSRSTVYENDTDVTDAEGVPEHSIAAVVEGGDVDAIAEVIAKKKAPGTGTYGTTSIVVIDDKGVPNTINFFALATVMIDVEVDITALTGYLSTTGTALRQAVVDYLNAQTIGDDSYLSRLFTPANLTSTGLGATYVVTAIRQSRDGNPPAAANVAIAFNEATLSELGHVILNVT